MKRYQSLTTFWQYLRPYRTVVAGVAISFAASSAFLATIPVFIGQLVDALPTASGVGDVWVPVVALITASSLHNASWRFSEYLFRKYIQPITYHYENWLFSRVLERKYSYFINSFTGKIASHINTLTNETKEVLTSFCFEYITRLVDIIGIFLILSSLNWQTGAVFLAGVIGMLLVGRYTLERDMHYNAIETDKGADKNAIIFDAIANFQAIFAYNSREQEVQAVAKKQNIALDAAQKSFLYGMIFWGSMSFFVRDFIWPASIVLNVWLYFQGGITLGQLSTLLATVLLFTATIWDAVWYLSEFGRKLARGEEAHSYLFANLEEVESGHDSVRFLSANRQIETTKEKHNELLCLI